MMHSHTMNAGGQTAAEGFPVDPPEVIWIAVQRASDFRGSDRLAEPFTKRGLRNGTEFSTLLGRFALRVSDLAHDFQEHQFHQDTGVVRLKTRVFLIIKKAAYQLYEPQGLWHSAYLRDGDMIGRHILSFEMKV